MLPPAAQSASSSTTHVPAVAPPRTTSTPASSASSRNTSPKTCDGLSGDRASDPGSSNQPKDTSAAGAATRSWAQEPGSEAPQTRRVRAATRASTRASTGSSHSRSRTVGSATPLISDDAARCASANQW